MPQIPRPQPLFQSLWIGGSLSPLEVLSIRSFTDRGLAYELYAYDEPPELPSGCNLRDAREVLPESAVFAYRHGPEKGSFSAFSNIFRYELLKQRGGWWVDTDVYCLAERWPEGTLIAGYQDQRKLNGAVLFAEPGHPAMTALAASATEAGRDVRWGQIGPNLVTKILTSKAFSTQLLSVAAFYPLPYIHAQALLVPKLLRMEMFRADQSFCIHFWNEILRRNAIRKDVCPPEGSLLHALYQRHQLLDLFREIYVVDHASKQLVAKPLRRSAK